MNKNDFKRLVNSLENGKAQWTDAQKLNGRVHAAVQQAALQSKKREEELFAALLAKEKSHENLPKRMSPVQKPNNS